MLTNAGAGPLTAFFLDAQRGWVVVVDEHGSGVPDRASVFATGDGGRTWVRQATDQDVGLGVRFVTPDTGWGVGHLGGVSRTDDGGRTWRRAELPTGSGPGGASFGLPTFAGSEGVIIGTIGEGDSPFLDATSDGGRTWRTVALPDGFRAAPTAPAIVGAGQWIVAGEHELLLTSDAGRSWTRRSIRDEPILGMAAADPNWIWVWTNVGRCATPKQDCAQYGLLLESRDGGVTWTEPADAGGPPLAPDATRLTIRTHCGVASAFVRGALWLADPPLGDDSGNPPPGWDENETAGSYVTESDGRILFTADSGVQARFKKAPPGTADSIAGCE